MIIGGGMQPSCMMKILEAEQWLKGTNPREVRSSNSSKTKATRHYLQDAVFLVGLESEDTALLQELETALKLSLIHIFL